VLDTALLLTSELVTNAIRYGSAPVKMMISMTDEVLRIEIDDHGQEFPAQRQPGWWEASGRGLQIVESLATRWGFGQCPRPERRCGANFRCARRPGSF